MALNFALLVIDVQKDFCEGGVLSARNTTSLIQPLNETISWTVIHKTLCVFTRDWHPLDHCSFVTEGGLWPVHCVQDSAGAEFAGGLTMPDSNLVLNMRKDINKDEISYSAFGSTTLEQDLKARNIDTLGISGIATEYCVRETVLDALKYNFKVLILTDLIRPIEVNPGDSGRALVDMTAAGATLISSIEWRNKLKLLF